jgi:hypothetical protein
MTDEESKRISARFFGLTIFRKSAMANALFDDERDLWLVRITAMTAMTEDKEFASAIRGIAAEGGSLKEALMNLADKINV